MRGSRRGEKRALTLRPPSLPPSFPCVPSPPPLQIAIGALGRVTRVPRFAAPEPAGAAAPESSLRVMAAHVLNVSWSADHRIVDGATLARFSNAFKGCAEQPLQLLL